MGKIKFTKRGVLMLTLLFVYIGGIQAQRDYRKGYIITNMNDTIHGWIDYRGEARNARICSFRETENGQATDYSPWDIAAYRFIDSKFYISKNIGNDDAPNRVFLEYLVNGMANLYYYREDNVYERYYIEKEGQFHELKIDEIKVEVGGITRTMPVKSYVGVLMATLNVWEMRDNIEKAKLEHKSLINIARDYHNFTCTDGSECIIYERREPLIALRIGPVVGVGFSTFKMVENKFLPFFNNDIGDFSWKWNETSYRFDPSTNFTVGINLNFSSPRMGEKLFLQIQAMYTKYHFFDVSQSSSSTIERHIKSDALQVGLGFKYEYPKGKLRPTLAAGGAIIWLPGVSYKEIRSPYSSYAVDKDLNSELLGFEIIPGIHYYLTNGRIVFVQAQYLQCSNDQVIKRTMYPNVSDKRTNRIQSLGISAGIYF